MYEQKAYIYNDDKGDDITVTEVPEDMVDDVELYRTELVEKILETDDELILMEYLEGRTSISLKSCNEKLHVKEILFQYVVDPYKNKGVQKL